jgi:esterase/lipase superfamily enzyme
VSRPDSLAAHTVFYATDRRAEDPAEPRRAYGGDRGETAYGTCRVTIPATHRPGELEGPKFPLLARWDAAKHVVLDAVEPLAPGAFWESLGRALSAPGNGEADVLLFVHGFNTTFEKAARRTAQMKHDMAFPGTAMFFSWPSDGSMTRYMADREDAEWSAYHLAEVLEALDARPRAGRIHVVAHSMGNQVLARALLEVARRRPRDRGPVVDNVILAAPDIDAELFGARIAPLVLHLAGHWTLYVSDRDVALDASAILGVRRLGTPLPVVPGVETVDASGVEVTPWSAPEFHDYYATKLKVVADLRAVLSGTPPAGRALEERRKEGAVYWALR